MTWDEWRFNFRFAWENPFLRWVSLVVCILLFAASAFAAVRLAQLGLPSGYIVTHYTVYLGIDQMLPLPWITAIIAVPILLILGTIFCGFVLFRQDSVAGYGLVVLSAISTSVWLLQLYHLVKINT